MLERPDVSVRDNGRRVQPGHFGRAYLGEQSSKPIGQKGRLACLGSRDTWARSGEESIKRSARRP
jgi:hypothetical protein